MDIDRYGLGKEQQLKISSPEHVFGCFQYLSANLEVEELLRFVCLPTNREWAKTPPKKRFQRRLNSSRAQEIASYILYSKAPLFSSLILAVEPRLIQNYFCKGKLAQKPKFNHDTNNQFQTVLPGIEKLHIVDGKQRIAALSIASDQAKRIRRDNVRFLDQLEPARCGLSEFAWNIERKRIPVIFFDFDVKLARNIFLTINRQQRRLRSKKSLEYDDDRFKT